MEDYEKLLHKILGKRPDLTEQEVERLVEEKLRSSTRLSRLGALLLVAEDLGIFNLNDEKPRDSLIDGFEIFTKISSLVAGLNDVSLRVRLLAISPLIRFKGKTFLRMKVGDETGKINAIAWDEKAEEIALMNLSPGMVLGILHAYTRETHSRSLMLNLGKSCKVVKMDEDGSIPSFESFFTSVSDMDISSRGPHDVKGYLLMVGELKRVVIDDSVHSLREVVLSDGKESMIIEAWGDNAELLATVPLGSELFFTDLIYRDGRLQTTSRSMLTKIVKDAVSIDQLEDSVGRILKDVFVKVLDVVHVSSNIVRIYVTDGSNIYKITMAPSAFGMNVGDTLHVRRAYVYEHAGAKALLPSEGCISIVRDINLEVPESVYVKKVSEISGEISDIILEGRLYSKTPIGYVDTRFGKVEKLNFWLKDGESVIFGSAWGNLAKEIDSIPIGKRTRIKWVKVIRNKFGELEIVMERWTRIEVLD